MAEPSHDIDPAEAAEIQRIAIDYFRAESKSEEEATKLMQSLAHAVKDVNGRSYNRTQYLKQRFMMIQKWADYLDKLATGGDVVQIKSA